MPTKKKKEDIINELTAIDQENDMYSGERVWSSPLARTFKSRSNGVSLEELIETNRIVDVNGLPCDPPPADCNTPKAKAEYYANWMNRQMKAGGVQFYEYADSMLPVKVSFDEKKKAVMMRKTPAAVAPKKPGWWNRRRDRQLIAEKGIGTPEMTAYRAAMKKLDDTAARRAELVAEEQRKREMLKPVIDFQKASYKKVSEFTTMSQAKFEKNREALLDSMANLMICDSFRRMHRNDSSRAMELLDNIDNAMLLKDKNYKAFSEKERDVVRERLSRIKSPAELKSFLENGGRGKLVNEFFVSTRVQQKGLANPNPEFLKTKTDELGNEVKEPDTETAERYKNLCGLAQKSLDSLKKVAEWRVPLPGNVQKDVRRDLAILIFQTMIARTIAVYPPESEDVRKMMEKLDKQMNGTAEEKKAFEEHISKIEKEYLGNLHIENMTGKDLGDFLSRGGETTVARNIIADSTVVHLSPEALAKEANLILTEKGVPKQDEPHAPANEFVPIH